MSLSILSDPAWHDFLLASDRQLAAEVKATGCLQCGGRLDSASFPRRPRGALVELDDAQRRRLSWCWAVAGCHERATPPSVRFLGRRVYLSAVVTLASAMEQGLSEFRVTTLRELIGVSAATLRRWRRWWLSMRAMLGFQRERAIRLLGLRGRCGVVTVVQRFGSALNMNVHRIIATVTGSSAVRAILERHGLSARPPRLSPAQEREQRAFEFL